MEQKNEEKCQSIEDKLEELTDEIIYEAKTKTELHREGIQESQFAIDLGQSLKNLIPIISEHPLAEDLIEDLEMQRDNFRDSNQVISILRATTSSTAGTISVTATSIVNSINPIVNKDFPLEKIEEIIEDFKHITNVDKKIEKLKEMMITFGLHNPYPGSKSAIEQLEIAFASLKTPVTDFVPISTSLIPMRQCIKDTVDFLLKKRSAQEKTKNWEDKVLSIGKNLKKDTIHNNNILKWAKQCKEIINELGTTKSGNFNREEWRYLFNKSVWFLISLLEGLDIEKMRH